MSKGKILVVDPDEDIQNMVNLFFTGRGYEVVCVATGTMAIQKANEDPQPNVIILEEELPDITGYETCRLLRSGTHTKHLPIIFFTKRLLGDRLTSFEIGADDYMTKPFHIADLHSRVKKIILREITRMFDSITNRPRMDLVEEYMREMMQHTNEWAYVEIKILNFNDFSKVYDYATHEVLRALSLYIGFAVDIVGTKYDFIGQLGWDCFCLVTQSEVYEDMLYAIVQNFEDIVVQHYTRQGFTPRQGKHVSTMRLEWGICDLRTVTPKNVREIIDLARDDLRQKAAQYRNDVLTT
jgi:DNA-binding response OmpR family regulator